MTTPLIVANIQPIPSLEAFIPVIRKAEILLGTGKIKTVHELEIALIGAARVRRPFTQLGEHDLI